MEAIIGGYIPILCERPLEESLDLRETTANTINPPRQTDLQDISQQLPHSALLHRGKDQLTPWSDTLIVLATGRLCYPLQLTAADTGVLLVPFTRQIGVGTRPPALPATGDRTPQIDRDAPLSRARVPVIRHGLAFHEYGTRQALWLRYSVGRASRWRWDTRITSCCRDVWILWYEKSTKKIGDFVITEEHKVWNQLLLKIGKITVLTKCYCFRIYLKHPESFGNFRRLFGWAYNFNSISGYNWRFMDKNYPKSWHYQTKMMRKIV